MKYGLNDEQWAAVSSEGPTLVNASAGSGKTRCLVAKIRYLIDNGAFPIRILAITFTNKAANEMKERLAKVCKSIEGMQVSTIHSMCVTIMKKFIHLTPLKVPFNIYDDNDQKQIIKTILKARDLEDDPSEVLSVISRAKGDNATDELNEHYTDIYTQYQKILVANNACDFDDLLVYAYGCLKNPECRQHFISRWQHILVDEVQDTSSLQYSIITALYDPSVTKTFWLCGDGNQSIYAFRGARPSNMINFIERYNPTVKDLTYNYRSCPQVIQQANEFLQFGKKMIAKSPDTGSVGMTPYASYEHEAQMIADQIKKSGQFDQTAILYRMNSRSLHFEQEFARRRIPYKVIGDRPFFSRKVPRDLIAYLRAAVNPSDIRSLSRIVNVPKRGFGAAKVEQLMNRGLPYLREISSQMTTIYDFMELLSNLKHKSPSEAVSEIVARTGYSQALNKDSDKDMLTSFQDVVGGYHSVEELIMASSFIEEDSGSGVKLMTGHASKGLEFDNVYVVGVEKTVWPHRNSEDIREEARLFYVACTRAKKFLQVSYAKSRMMRNKPMPLEPSDLFMQMHRNMLKDHKL